MTPATMNYIFQIDFIDCNNPWIFHDIFNFSVSDASEGNVWYLTLFKAAIRPEIMQGHG